MGGKRLYVAVQNTEKVPHTVTVTAHGPGGHASIPLAGNAILRLGRALAKISDYREPVQVNPTTREFFTQLAAVWPTRDERAAMADVASSDPRRVQRGARVLGRTAVFDAVLRNGISATIIQGGIRGNVIPTEATATLNVRTLPGQSIDGVVARLKKVVNDSLVDIEITSRAVGRAGVGLRVADVRRDSRERERTRPVARHRAVPEHGRHGQRAAARMGDAGIRVAPLPDEPGRRGPHARQR